MNCHVKSRLRQRILEKIATDHGKGIVPLASERKPRFDGKFFLTVLGKYIPANACVPLPQEYA